MGNKFFYCYNHRQADYFLKNGIAAKGSGYGAKGDAYILFINDDKLKEVFKRWNEVDNLMKQYNK